MFNIIIKNGFLVDGSGVPGSVRDIGVKEDLIAAVGVIDTLEAQEVVDATGHMICPGFIDIHSHSDFNLLAEPPGRSKIMQGVTTEVCGNCGVSGAPLMGKAKEHRQKSLSGLGVEISWSTMGEYSTALKHKKLFSNIMPLVGHGNLRGIVIGYENRRGSEADIRNMSALFRECMEAGAWGLSSGLFYPPGVYAHNQEIIALAKIAADYDAIYASHIRNEENTVVEAIIEALEVAYCTGIPVQISHLKTMGEKNWEKLPLILEKIEKARDTGLDVTADRYPYTAASTDLDSLLPAWACEGGIDAELCRLQNKTDREKIYSYIVKDTPPEYLFDKIMISRVNSRDNKQLEGKTLLQASLLRQESLEETFFNLLIEEELKVAALFFNMSEQNLHTMYQKEYVMIGSDSSVWDIEGPLGDGRPHPRGFGTFPRVFSEYVFKKKILTLENAVHKMTGQVSKKIGLKDRGIVQKGWKADLVILKAEDIKDTSTYANPHQFPAGISRVMVNGQWVIKNGMMSGVYPGTVLFKNG
jgi:N-acyl-D-amino-acid deacylase